MVGILHQQRDGGAKSQSKPHSGEDLNPVLFDSHAPAAAIPTLSPSEILVDV